MEISPKEDMDEIIVCMSTRQAFEEMVIKNKQVAVAASNMIESDTISITVFINVKVSGVKAAEMLQVMQASGRLK